MPFFEAANHIVHALPSSISIDNLIEARKGDTNEDAIVFCAKLAIIASILKAERGKEISLYVNPSNAYNTLDLTKLEKSWYAKFFGLLTLGCNCDDEFKLLKQRLKNLTLIIFNYDRCIEQYLYYAFQDYYGIDGEKSAELIAMIAIIHPYGDVGKLAFQSERKNGDIMDFGADYTADDLKRLTNRIVTFSERIEEGKTIEKMRNHFFNADKIIFLGFAFHEQNLKLLKSDYQQNLSSVKPECFLNFYGVSESNQEVIKSDIADITSSHCPKNSKDAPCEEFFNEFSRSLRFD